MQQTRFVRYKSVLKHCGVKKCSRCPPASCKQGLESKILQGMLCHVPFAFGPRAWMPASRLVADRHRADDACDVYEQRDPVRTQFASLVLFEGVVDSWFESSGACVHYEEQRSGNERAI